ncbi:MAG: biotin/lipoyl-containing protein [Pseudomonadota bacterium]
MSVNKTIEVTGLDDFEDVEVVELLVDINDEISKDQSIITMESDKATMEFPSPDAGVVKEIKVAVGDKVGSKAGRSVGKPQTKNFFCVA